MDKFSEHMDLFDEIIKEFKLKSYYEYLSEKYSDLDLLSVDQNIFSSKISDIEKEVKTKQSRFDELEQLLGQQFNPDISYFERKINILDKNLEKLCLIYKF